MPKREGLIPKKVLVQKKGRKPFMQTVWVKPVKAGSNVQQAQDPKQDYKQNGVRSKAFKAWFGDWENDPENASKVVDENGKPKSINGVYVKHKENLKTNIEDYKNFNKVYEWAFGLGRKSSKYSSLDENVDWADLPGDISDLLNNPDVKHNRSRYEAALAGFRDGQVNEKYDSFEFVIAKRIGGVPESGFSYNYRDEFWEPGLSVLGYYENGKYIEQNDSTYKTFNPGDEHYVFGIKTLRKGSDGESVLLYPVDLGIVSNQIKAVDNEGTFNPGDNNMYKSKLITLNLEKSGNLIKARAASIGEIRTQGGVRKRKVKAGVWVPVDKKGRTIGPENRGTTSGPFVPESGPGSAQEAQDDEKRKRKNDVGEDPEAGPKMEDGQGQGQGGADQGKQGPPVRENGEPFPDKITENGKERDPEIIEQDGQVFREVEPGIFEPAGQSQGGETQGNETPGKPQKKRGPLGIAVKNAVKNAVKRFAVALEQAFKGQGGGEAAVQQVEGTGEDIELIGEASQVGAEQRAAERQRRKDERKAQKSQRKADRTAKREQKKQEKAQGKVEAKSPAQDITKAIIDKMGANE